MLKPEGVNAFTEGLSGSVFNIGVVADPAQGSPHRGLLNCTRENMHSRCGDFVLDEVALRDSFERFLAGYLHFKPLHDLHDQQLHFPECAQVLRKLQPGDAPPTSTSRPNSSMP